MNPILREYASRFEDAETTPVVFVGAVGPLAIGGAGQSAPESDMVNRTGKPILIDEIRIACSLLDGSAGTVNGQLLTGGITPLQGAQMIPDDAFSMAEAPVRQLQARFTLGGIQLSRDWVQVWGLSGDGDARGNSLVMVWKPPVPIYVEHGELLKVDIRYPSYAAPAILTNAANSIPNPSVTPQVAFAARVLEDPNDWLAPGEARALPYVTSFLPAALAMFATPGTVYSSLSDLMNATEEPLYIHALIGKCLSQIFDCNIGDTDVTIATAAGASKGPLANIPERGLLVRMETSEGISIVKDPTPFGHLFSPVDSTWWMNAVLNPRQSLTVYLDVALNVVNEYVDDGTKVQPSITLHGMFFSAGIGSMTRWSQGSRDAELAQMGQSIGVR